MYVCESWLVPTVSNKLQVLLAPISVITRSVSASLQEIYSNRTILKILPQMVRLKINGIPVELPHQPYVPQLVTISKLLSCFQNGASSLIESPTGTGKSLSIICSVLAYNNFIKTDIQRNDEEKQPYRIIICSRTHKQLEQLVHQLKKTVYSPRITILGSRSQYCVNPRLQEADDKNTMCSELVKEGKCVFFGGKEKLAKKIADRLLDIEELRSEGKKCAGCPYFASRILTKDADVIFAPYNYLIDSKVREAVDIPLARSIIIIDEAHNIEDVCRTAGSLELTSQIVELITNDLLGAIKRSAYLGQIKGDFVNILDLFRRLREYAEHSGAQKSLSGANEPFFDSDERGVKLRIRTAQCVVEELERIGIKKDLLLVLKSSLKNIAADDEAKDLLNLNSTRVIEDINKVLEMIFEGCNAYAFCFQRGVPADKYSFNLWLLDPSTVFQRLAREVWSISLLSGTLTPFSSFNSELGFKFTHQLVAPHILQSSQVFVAAVRTGHLGTPLCGTFSVMETLSYLDQIVSALKSITAKMDRHGGVVVFVPSYAFLARLAAKMPEAVAEPRIGGAAAFEKALKRYRMRIVMKKPALLLCVFRGKAAEGTDFRDEYARAVVTVGIPYPSVRDPQIALKKEYNDKKGGFNGRMWYEAQAYRALNQALGRVVRHSADWGALYLLDCRFSEKRYQARLPQWVTANLRCYDKYADTLNDLDGFLDHKKPKDTE